jgi:cytochrome b
MAYVRDDETDVPEVKVWDIFVRVSHWVIVAGFLIAYLSEDDFLTIHVWAGYTVGALASLRILWGFVGPKYARFRDFVCGPGKVFGYARDLTMFRAKRHLGHSPAGGAMVIALLAGLIAISVTGVALYAVEENAGPLAGVLGDATGEARNHEDESAAEEFLEEVHEVLANLVLILVVLHVAGVGLASLVHRENLARSMVTGRKRAP